MTLNAAANLPTTSCYAIFSKLVALHSGDIRLNNPWNKTMPNIKHPGVYIQEIPTIHTRIVAVPTAVPAFIGYTQNAARKKDGDLHLTPTKITSFEQYCRLFGQSEAEPLHLELTSTSGGMVLKNTSPVLPRQMLWYAIRLFFDNGGGECYVVSTGNYQISLTLSALSDGVQAAAKVDEITLLIAPESVLLATADYQQIVNLMLSQCDQLADRMALFDLPDGDKSLNTARLSTNRANLGNNHLDFGACYYPFLTTTQRWQSARNQQHITVSLDNGKTTQLSQVKADNPEQFTVIESLLADLYVCLPASVAVAGAIALVDASEGVWKAPANVQLRGISHPMVSISDTANEVLNTDTSTGKSINAIREFSGRGVRIWGARTLAGNDNQWRYLSTRRLANMVQESVQKSLSWAVFEPNDANTWARVTLSVEQFLVNLWKLGALTATRSDEAFYAHCGLGTTMTANDIHQGIMNIEIGMAVVRPAGFIILRLQLHSQQA